MKKIVLIISIVFISILIAILLLISPIVKYVIEKNSIDLTGRQIKIDELRINLLSGTLNIAGFRFYEKNGKEIFVSCGQISTSVNLWKAINSEYEIQQFVLSGLKVQVVQKGEHFNFDDIIQHFSDTSSVDTTASEPVKYWLRNLNLMDATISYVNNDYHTDIELQSLNLQCPVISWNDPKEKYDFDFKLKSGGDFKGKFNIDIDKLDYVLNFDSKQINLSVLFPYLKPYIKLRSIEGLLSTDMHIQGNFNIPDQATTKIAMRLEKFALVDTLGDPLLSLGLFEGSTDSVNLGTDYHNMNSMQFIDPYLKYETYDDGDNWTRLMKIAEASSEVEVDTTDYSNPFRLLSVYMGMIVDSYSTSTYLIDSLIVRNMEVQYTDFTLPSKFSFNLDQMNLISGSLNTGQERFKFDFNCRLNKKGIAKAKISVDPKDYREIELSYSLDGLPISSFNPYMTYYVAWPFASGDIHCTSESTIHNGYLKSKNLFQVLKINVGEKSSDKPLYKMPVKLAIGLLKDPKGNIDFEIPIEGDLNDPNYRIGKIVWKILGNLMVKAVTAPYNLLARAIGGKEEDLKDVSIRYTQAGFSDIQWKTIDKIAKALIAKPDIGVVFIQQNDSVEEIEQLAMVEARRKYAMAVLAILPGDTVSSHVAAVIDSINVKDSAFIAYVNTFSLTKDFAISEQEKCIKLVGAQQLIALRSQLMQERQNTLKSYLVNEKGIDPIRIKFKAWEPAKLDPGAIPRFVYEIDIPADEL